MAIKTKERSSPPPVRVRILAKDVIFAYAHGLYTPSAIEAGAVERYSVSIVMLPDNPAIELIDQAVPDVITAHWGEKAKWPRRLKGYHTEPVLKEADKFPKMGIKTPGCMFVRAYSNGAPVVVNAKREELLGAALRKECYSGREGNASFTIYVYDRKFEGVGVGIGNIQLLGRGERLGAPRPGPEDEFDKEELPAADNDDNDDESGDDDFTPTPRRRR